MEQSVFTKSFPAFPCDEESLKRLGEIFAAAKVISAEAYSELQQANQDPQEFLRALALRSEVSEEALARAEADILNVPFIKVDEIEISQDAFKLINPKVIASKHIIPIQINGAELIVGTTAPGDPSILTETGSTMALKPAKVLEAALSTKIAHMTGAKTEAPKKNARRKRIGDILVELNYVSKEKLDEAFTDAKKEKLRIGAYLVKHGLITNKQLSIALSKQFNIAFVDLDESLVDPVLASLLPKKLCYDFIICPVKRENNKLVLAMTDPTDIITIDHVEMMSGMRVTPVVASELSINSALGNLYGESIDALGESIGGPSAGEDAGGDELEMDENDAPIIKLVNLILMQAVNLNVSDIHIEIYETELRIRFRQDGAMRLFMTPARAAHAGVVSRIKVMANLDIAETRKPQDGRIKLHMQNRKIDLRVSIIPCIWGEKIVMRICDQGNLKVNLTDLGFEPFVLEKFMAGVKAPNGIVLVTGPTGSGKTTTLYSSLFLLNNPSVNIMTAEDPVEYNLMGINQVQCHADIGLDFSAALRSFLRQDPDVIMLGEIRDFETASIAIKAALTGHLVISTLHTNDAPATVARLLNMGIEPFSLSSSLRIVEAQRLVKRVCKSCAKEYKPDKDLLQTLGIDEKLLKRLHLDDKYNLDNIVFKKGEGCADCDKTGLKGRQGIYEVIALTQEFRELIENRANTEEMRRQAIADGMLSLRDSAIYKLITGITTTEEVFHTTVDSGGAESEEDEIKKPKMAETSSDKPKPHISIASEKAKESKTEKATEAKAPDKASEAAVQAEKQATAQAQSLAAPQAEISAPSISNLTKELHEFTNILSKVSLGSNTENMQINPEILKRGIALPLNLLREQAAKTQDPSKVLPIVRAQGQKIDFNLKNLITYFAPPSYKPSKIQINQFIDKYIIASLKQHVITARLVSGNKNIGKNLKISKNLFAKLPMAVFDSEAFTVVAANLLVNALVALGEKGGEIKIVTMLKPKTTNKIELLIFDNGVGIPKERQKNLFKAFIPGNSGSLGLGLAVSKKLLDTYHGSISIKGMQNGNTLVVVELPAAV